MPSHIPTPRKLASLKNINHVWKEFTRKKNPSGFEYEEFKANLPTNLATIRRQLISHNYTFRKLRFHPIEKEDGKYRIICIPTFQDRFVQRLILNTLLKYTTQLGINNELNYGSIPGSGGSQKAIQVVLNNRIKHPWVLKTDISSFFDKIDRTHLLAILQKKLRKSSLLPLLEKVIYCEIFANDAADKQLLKNNGIISGQGLRQGMPLSPFLSNVFLCQFDKIMSKQQGKTLRYADDILVLCNSLEESLTHKNTVEEELSKIRLSIPSLNEADSKTKILAPDESVIFLGMEIYKKNNSYLAKIPNASINNILTELNQYANYEYVTKKRLNYANLSRKLDDKQYGYKAAYKNASNLETFIIQIKKKKKEIKNNLLSTILGEPTLNSLSEDKKHFLGLQ